MLKVRRVSPKLRIEIGEWQPQVPGWAALQVDEIWRQEKSRRGDQLFNGPVLSFLGCDGETIETCIADYKTFIAQVRSPSLYDVFKIRLLAVSGLMTLESKIAFGKRAVYLTQDPGKWELAPSGGVALRGLDQRGKISLEDQFFEELSEECGISRAMVASVAPFLLLEDTVANVVDIAMRASVRPYDMDDALAQKSDEYSELRWLEIDKLAGFCGPLVQNNGIVAVSLEILRAWLPSLAL